MKIKYFLFLIILSHGCNIEASKKNPQKLIQVKDEKETLLISLEKSAEQKKPDVKERWKIFNYKSKDGFQTIKILRKSENEIEFVLETRVQNLEVTETLIGNAFFDNATADGLNNDNFLAAYNANILNNECNFTIMILVQNNQEKQIGFEDSLGCIPLVGRGLYLRHVLPR